MTSGSANDPVAAINNQVAAILRRASDTLRQQNGDGTPQIFLDAFAQAEAGTCRFIEVQETGAAARVTTMDAPRS